MTTDKRRFNGEGNRVAEQVKFRIQPRYQWVLVRKIEREEQVGPGGVIIPGGGRSQRGEVVAAAPNTGLNEGDVVIYTNFPLELEDLEELTGEKNLQLIRDEEVYALVVPCT